VPLLPLTLEHGTVGELLEAMRDEHGACEFGAFRRYEENRTTGCSMLDHLTYNLP